MNAPTISLPMLRFFRRIVSGYFRRHFSAVRVSRASRFAHDGSPLIVYANHSSWWDPMVSILLAAELMPEQNHYAPMDAEALERYRILKRLGIFPIEMKSARGAVQFLRTGMAVLASGGVLWVTPQGRFSDPRERPLQFKPGLAALAARVGSCTLLPLAIEYPFWDERLPETLLLFGDAVQVVSGDNEAVIEKRLVLALEAAMNDLQALSLTRNATVFTTLAQGTVGTGGFYALWRRVKAGFQRQPYRPEHTIIQKTSGAREGHE